ncbi:peptidyl-tRNA hydrolase [Candidatus Woesearchaeota archaeon]|nr:peptidyl-tRNA hydrolase [Candidatus Woesearchaeota archaeon]
MSSYKQVILVRKDLKLPPGKLAAQVGHACVEAVLLSNKMFSNKKAVKAWRQQGSKKIVLKVADEEELHKYAMMAKNEGMITSTIQDAGRTVIAPGTVTCCAIGPDVEEKIDKITSKLKML